jgi:hypothetical protein
MAVAVVPGGFGLMKPVTFRPGRVMTGGRMADSLKRRRRTVQEAVR